MTLPFNLTLVWALRLGALAAIGIAGLWLVDAIGDRREAKVHARYAKVAEAVNLKIEDFTSEDERVAAISEAIRQKALASARTIPASNTCPASKDQAAALSQIR